MELFYSIFPGISEMPNIHPLAVHFPIALISAFLLTELLGLLTGKEELRAAATWMLYLGTLGALGAVAAGLWAATTVQHLEEAHAILLRHRNLGITVLALSIILSSWRIYARGRFSKRGQALHLVIAFVTALIMALGADKGGLMVYKYGVGVKAVKAQGHIHDGMGGMSQGEGEDIGAHSEE